MVVGYLTTRGGGEEWVETHSAQGALGVVDGHLRMGGGRKH